MESSAISNAHTSNTQNMALPNHQSLMSTYTPTTATFLLSATSCHPCAFPSEWTVLNLHNTTKQAQRRRCESTKQGPPLTPVFSSRDYYPQQPPSRSLYPPSTKPKTPESLREDDAIQESRWDRKVRLVPQVFARLRKAWDQLSAHTGSM